jgi:hypothetical protein
VSSRLYVRPVVRIRVWHVVITVELGGESASNVIYYKYRATCAQYSFAVCTFLLLLISTGGGSCAFAAFEARQKLKFFRELVSSYSSGNVEAWRLADVKFVAGDAHLLAKFRVSALN